MRVMFFVGCTVYQLPWIREMQCGIQHGVVMVKIEEAYLRLSTEIFNSVNLCNTRKKSVIYTLQYNITHNLSFTDEMKERHHYPSLSFICHFYWLWFALHILPPQHEAKHFLGYEGRFSPASQVVLRAGCGSHRLLPHIWAHTPACRLGLHWGLPAEAHRRWRLGEQRSGRRPLLLQLWWASPLVRWGWDQTRVYSISLIGGVAHWQLFGFCLVFSVFVLTLRV